MDQYSSVITTRLLTTKTNDTLGKVYARIRRESKYTPGRTLSVTFDERVEMDFNPVYSYVVQFEKQPHQPIAPAGNHWHEDKQEIFMAVSGDFRILLEDISTKQVIEYTLRSQARDKDNSPIHELLYIPRKVAHAVHPLSDGSSSLLVMASSAAAYTDTFSYTINEPAP